MKSIIFASAIIFANATYPSDLKCSKCIKNGYTFCHKGTEGQLFENGQHPEYTCCTDATCPEASDPSYTCSSTYKDLEYALTFCPQPKDKCGDRQEINFEGNGFEILEPLNLDEGESCTYKLKSSCGSPAFKIDYNGLLNVTYLEFESAKVNTTSGGQGNHEGPYDGMPSRNTSFFNSGNQASYRG
jgi:hypothetical protein